MVTLIDVGAGERVGRTWVEIVRADVAKPCLRCQTPTLMRIRFRSAKAGIAVCSECR